MSSISYSDVNKMIDTHEVNVLCMLWELSWATLGDFKEVIIRHAWVHLGSPGNTMAGVQ